MKIILYECGKIENDGKVYASDVVVCDDHVNSSWWRNEGHLWREKKLKYTVKKINKLMI